MSLYFEFTMYYYIYYILFIYTDQPSICGSDVERLEVVHIFIQTFSQRNDRILQGFQETNHMRNCTLCNRGVGFQIGTSKFIVKTTFCEKYRAPEIPNFVAFSLSLRKQNYRDRKKKSANTLGGGQLCKRPTRGGPADKEEPNTPFEPNFLERGV